MEKKPFRERQQKFFSLQSVLLLTACIAVFACRVKPPDRTAFFPKLAEPVAALPAKQNLWVFVMAGQSNMAGRGQVEPQDTVALPRLLTIDRHGQLVLAKEPLHFYEPALTGLDCGYAFGKTLLEALPDSISVLLVPTAVGGSAISQWLGDSVYRNVRLFSNFSEKLALAQTHGTLKAVLWHQGESDANPVNIPLYQQRLTELVRRFRSTAGQERLPVLLGELGRYSADNENWMQLTGAIHAFAATDPNTAVINTRDLKDKGDRIHFNSKGQRKLGKRFAQAYLDRFYRTGKR